VSLPALVRHDRQWVVPLPLAWVKQLVRLARLFGDRDEFTWLDLMDTTITVNCQRAEQVLGWRPVHTPWQTVQEMRSAPPVARGVGQIARSSLVAMIDPEE
jgi:hypothetical protein